MPASFTRGLPIDDYVAIASFLYFGIKSLLDAREIGGQRRRLQPRPNPDPDPDPNP